MPARSTAYYLLLKHTGRTVDSYCSFLDIHLLHTPPCCVQLDLHLVEETLAESPPDLLAIKALPTAPRHPRPYGKGIAPRGCRARDLEKEHGHAGALYPRC
ncbi:MAG TPA: hypothetical protein VKB35_13255 [Ktedonobacteraceae bacterium]|nr:hypothetical protein [Ktedonobacteraceae bacterium]